MALFLTCEQMIIIIYLLLCSMFFILALDGNVFDKNANTILNTLQENAHTEVKAVQKNLENTESELEKNEEECSKLRTSVDSEHQANSSLKQHISKLEKELNEERSNSLNVQKTLTR